MTAKPGSVVFFLDVHRCHLNNLELHYHGCRISAVAQKIPPRMVQEVQLHPEYVFHSKCEDLSLMCPCRWCAERRRPNHGFHTVLCSVRGFRCCETIPGMVGQPGSRKCRLLQWEWCSELEPRPNEAYDWSCILRSCVALVLVLHTGTLHL